MNYIQLNYLLESGTENSMLTAEPSINKINRVNYVCSVELFLTELLTKKNIIMRKMLQSELFVVANLISFIALFCAIFIIAMSDNYNPTAIGTMLPMRIIMWGMLLNFVCLLCSIGSLELDNRK